MGGIPLPSIPSYGVEFPYHFNTKAEFEAWRDSFSSTILTFMHGGNDPTTVQYVNAHCLVDDPYYPENKDHRMSLNGAVAIINRQLCLLYWCADVDMI
jgi:hypothetical protein